MLDGVDNNETWLQTVVLFPSVDALDEFKLQTSTYSAEFGRSLGGVVNLQIKSGTNTLHGSAFEFLRNDAFDANNFFNNRAGREKPDFSQHQYGGTIGGPLIKDKTFYFFDYQGYKINQGATYLSTVPSAKMRAGDFSELNRVIFDPVSHLPFPGNVIPQARWDPVAKNILGQLIPESNTGGISSATGQTINNYLINPTLERQDNQIDIKVDHSLSGSNRLCDAVQLREDPPGAAGDAAARRRRFHLRRRRRQHQGAGAVDERHAHVQLELVERGALRLELDQVPDDAGGLRDQHRTGRRPQERQPR